MSGRADGDDPKLCYVDPPWAYFTTAPLAQQWGDDWDDSPYEHNAGPPYEWGEWRDMPPYRIIRVAYLAELMTPAKLSGGSSPWTVERINSGAVAWLMSPYWSDEGIAIMAGTSLAEFRRLIKYAGGDVFESSTSRVANGK